MLKITVASKNPIKLQAAHTAFVQMLDPEVQIEGLAVPSEIRDQPLSDEETLEGAIVGCLNVLGEDKVLDLLSKCDFTIYEDEEENGESESVTEEGVEESLDIPQPEEATSPV